MDTRKHSILDVWKGSEYASAEKQGRCTVRKKNSQRRYVKCDMWYVICVLKYFNDIS